MATICWDIDGVLATTQYDANYANAEPIYENIEVVRRMHVEGHVIILQTARGFTTKINWTEVTEKQMREWGVPFHMLLVGSKPSADYYVDDKAVHVDDVKKLEAQLCR